MPSKRDREKKAVASRAVSNVGKIPRIDAANIFDPHQDNFDWSLDSIDVEGPFSWRSMSKADFYQIAERLRNLETMLWNKVEGSDNHFVSVDSFSRPAKQRLSEIARDDESELFSLHVDNKLRIWGSRQGKVLKLLWYDPDHAVCPSPKKGS